ncbi:hypothetical protein FRC11_014283, partial [Ceratobasidium sp. 423]
STTQDSGRASRTSVILRPFYLFAGVSPLTAALIAPLAVLLDIPALTEKWYTRNGQPQSDPRASLILSGLSLGFSLIANALLVVRFSLQGKGWTAATRISVVCWVIRVVTGIANLVVFGALTRNQPQFTYAEGFWAAVVSEIASGFTLVLLLLHWVFEFKRDPSQDDQPSTPTHTKLQVRVAGRHFMLQNTMLIALIALTALIFSRIQQTHKARARAEREKAWQISQMKSDNPSLQREIAFLADLHKRQGWREQGVDLTQSMTGFLVFWFVGAAIFGAVESWSYGDSLYFCYVFFLSIGYGDFAPISPAGRVTFIVYSLMAVPIMASFAVQAIQNIFERLSKQRMDKRQARFGDETSQAIAEIRSGKKDLEKDLADESRDEMHSTLVVRFHSQTEDADKNTDIAVKVEDLKSLLEHAVSLERVARRLLVAHLEEGSPAQILLRADWNLQSRDLRVLESESERRGPGNLRISSEFRDDSKSDGTYKAKGHTLAATEAGIAGTSQSREEEEEAKIAATAVGWMDDKETLKAVREFRRNVAGVLALGSRLRELEGTEKYVFERRRRLEEHRNTRKSIPPQEANSNE